MTPTEINQNGPHDEVDVPSSGRISIGLQEGYPDSQSSRVPALGRSDDKPGLGVMCGGKEQAQQTWQEKLQGKAPGWVSETHI
jgi:hypothetical protein